MAKDIVCTFASSQAVNSERGIFKLLGVDRKNIKKAKMWRILLDTKKDAFWLNYKRLKRSNYLPNSLKKIIVERWIGRSTISLNRKEVMRRHIGITLYESHVTHYL
jgi:hypothetical protein